MKFPVEQVAYRLETIPYEGLGHDESVSNAGATGDMDLNCGIGNFEISFSKES